MRTAAPVRTCCDVDLSGKDLALLVVAEVFGSPLLVNDADADVRIVAVVRDMDLHATADYESSYNECIWGSVG